MCVAMPGKVIEVNQTKATVDFGGNLIEAQTGIVKVDLGDYVLVHAGCVIQVLSEFDKKMLLELLEEIENA
ncbi:MAG: hydrogenase assembly chaperone HypC [Oscillospiraceae bacterium]|nr:hydrogenase assembly chaperone HypC [Oscillospiraceae bacterium]